MSRKRFCSTDNRCCVNARQNGMSLIELMVGLVIGLILIGGVIQTLLVSKEASKGRQSMATISENARFVFEFMARDMRMAGRNFDAVASLPIEYDATSSSLKAYYTIPLPASSTEKHVAVTYRHDGNAIRYKRVEDGANTINDETLIDGVSALNFIFGKLTTMPDIAASVPGEVRYFDLSDSSDRSAINDWDVIEWAKVISLRAEIELEDPAAQANDVELENNAISQTISLRNRLLKNYQP